MPRVASEKQYNTFVKGVITEANPLTYPENATIDEDNFVLKRDGSRERRLGMEYEVGYAYTTSLHPISSEANLFTQFYKWEKAGGSRTIGIVRVGRYLWFVDLQKGNPSGNVLQNVISSSPYHYVTIPNLSNNPAEFTTINNSVVVVSKSLYKPVLLTYDSATGYVTKKEINIEVRDMWGIDDSLSLTARPTTLSIPHHYNILNQGWGRLRSFCASTYPSDYTCLYDEIGIYPSNSDIASYGKYANTGSSNYQLFHPTTFMKSEQLSSEAPKGHYIIDPFFRGNSRGTKSGLSSVGIPDGIPLDYENGRPTTVTSFAGRVFFSGIESMVSAGDDYSPNFSNCVFFSQLVTNNNDIGKCYQVADPTSPDISDIVDTDGGVIQIPEVTKIVKLVSTKTSLLVFTVNGIWEIYAGDTGFKATEYQINKVTDVGTLNADSVVSVNGLVAYWANGGMYLLQPDNVTGRFVAQNMSLTTIQTWYNNLSEAAKSHALGIFDEKENVIRWLYNDTDSYDGVSYRRKYNRELVFDISLSAFYFTSISQTASTPYVAGFITLPNYVDRDVVENVVAGGVQVVAGGVDVTTTIAYNEPRGVSLKYLTLRRGTTMMEFTISEYRDTAFVDWKTATTTGISYKSYMLTGHELFGDMMRTKQVPYLMMFFKRTEDGFDSNIQLENQSSCLVQSRWGWTDSANSGRWGNPFQAYRFRRNYIPSGQEDTFDYGESVIFTKNKLRGSGKSLALYIESEAGKDMKLLGWAITMSGNSQP